MHPLRTLAAFGISCGTFVAACSATSNNVNTASLGGTAPTGGRTGSESGGANASGGTTTIGGNANTGGANPSGGANATGGQTATGGVAASGGSANTGGSKATGGLANTGGKAGTGGNASTGGSKATGGLTSTGGKAGTGGNASTGGSSSTGGAANAGGSSAQLGCTSSDATYKLVWSDEFSGAAGSALDASKWTYDVGGNGWGNSELEYYTSGTANASMDGTGNLVITAKAQSMSGMNYTSARIKTAGLATWTYGRIEARIKVPKGQGLWPAFWLLGADIDKNPWPACGEIDVMENIGKEPNVIHGSMHGPGYSGGSGPTAQTSLSAPVGDAFHVFAIEWEQNAIRWYVDGALYSTKTPSNIPSGATWAYAHPFFIILNVAVGGTWPGNPDPTVFPQQMLVDYVRVCQH